MYDWPTDCSICTSGQGGLSQASRGENLIAGASLFKVPGTLAVAASTWTHAGTPYLH